jgi:hypothetical protein
MSNHPHRNTERVTVENLRGDAERVTLPAPHWTGREESRAGVILQALYRGPRTGRMFARSFSMWQAAPGQGSRGTIYQELSESDYLRLCELAGCEPIADATIV